MSVILDTHVWLWWLLGQPDLPARERSALDTIALGEAPLLPAICLWEAQMLHAKGRLTLTLPFDRWLMEAAQSAVVRIAPLDVQVVLAIDDLPSSFHGDPADRIIVATARALTLPLATHDRRIRRCRLVKIWRP
ncbi:MAG: type II toxin-antitoxin system VapC family toxin [Vicinamibacterales bacterium]